MKKGFILIAVLLSILLCGNVWAVDDTDIQELQTDVSSTKSKADKNQADIESLKGGLPTEEAERIAADTNLQNQINSIQLIITDFQTRVDTLEGLLEVCYDDDGDGYGNGYGCLGLDCDDTDRYINPEAYDICDGKDNDCNNTVDDNCAVIHEIEPNGEWTAAQDIGEASVDSQLFVHGTFHFTYYGDQDYDYYKIEVPPDATLIMLNMYLTPVVGGCTDEHPLGLYDQDKTLLYEQNGFMNFVVNPGVYYILVEQFYYYFEPWPYYLSIGIEIIQ